MKKLVKTNISSIKGILSDFKKCLGDMPLEIWLDIRTDTSGAFASIRHTSKNNSVSFRIKDAVVEGDTSDVSFPFYAKDWASIDASGSATIEFVSPGVIIDANGDDTQITAIPYPNKIRPFPCNGSVEISAESGKAIGRFLDLYHALSINNDIRIRVRKDGVFIYASNGSTMAICQVQTVFQESPVLWDIELPIAIVKRIAEYGAIIDHIDNVGTWISDGNNYLYSTHIPNDIPLDIPGIARAIKAYPNRMVINPEFYDSISSGYYLLSLSAGCVDSNRIVSDSLAYDKDIVVEGAKYTQLPYRGESILAVVDADVIIKTCGVLKKGMVHFTNWPFAPCVVSDGIVDIISIPPVCKPSSLIPYASNINKDIVESLRVTQGNSESITVKPFIGTHASLSSFAYPNPPKTETDSLFLISTVDSLIRVGGVTKAQLASFLFEMGNTDAYTRVTVDTLNSGRYWLGLNIYVYDLAFIHKYGEDLRSPHKGWITWEFWSDPEGTSKKDANGTSINDSMTPVVKPRIKLSSTSFTPPSPKKTQIETVALDPKEVIEVTGYSHILEKEKLMSDIQTKYDYIIIDSDYITWRDFHQKALQNFSLPVSGKKVGVVLGYMHSVKSWIRTFKPKQLLAVWDGGIAKWRREILPEYKVKDKDKVKISEEDFRSINEQRQWIRSGLTTLGIHSIHIRDTEADDVATLVADALSKQGNVLIITGDKDYNQLVSDRIHIWYDRNDELMHDKSLASSALLYKCIVGDPSDKIQGVVGVGEKTLNGVFDSMRASGIPITYESLIDFVSKNAPSTRSKKLLSEESSAVIKRNIELIDLYKGMSKLPVDAMIEAITKSTTPFSCNLMEFSLWASSLNLNSITEEMSDWQRIMTLCGVKTNG